MVVDRDGISFAEALKTNNFALVWNNVLKKLADLGIAEPVRSCL